MITDWPHVLTPREAARVIAFKGPRFDFRPAPRHVDRQGLRAEIHAPAFSLMIGKRIGRELHPRWYVYRYEVGGFIAPHHDAQTDLNGRATRESFLLYLTTSSGGGETIFHVDPPEVRVPRAGDAVSFGYGVRHEAARVDSGVKWCMRSDIF